jgi:NTE family protein
MATQRAERPNEGAARRADNAVKEIVIADGPLPSVEATTYVSGAQLRLAIPEGTRVGLVLGAGGTVGCAYHAGVLYSLYHHTGWDARDAVSIVGTSAGSLVGALLRCGVAPDELADLTNGGPVSRVHERLQRLHLASETEPPKSARWAGPLRAPTVAGLWRSARHRSGWPAILSMVRPARFDLRQMVGELDRLSGWGWPDSDLRICAVSTASGRRRVLDSDAGVYLSTAVAASCAVPGLFAPQRVGGEWLVDGAVHSATNVDVTPFDRVDEVWVIAPMAGDVFQHWAMSPLRSRINAALRQELLRVPPEVRVRLFQPGPEASAAMGVALMSKDRSASTVLAGFLEAGDLVVTTQFAANGAETISTGGDRIAVEA